MILQAYGRKIEIEFHTIRTSSVVELLVQSVFLLRHCLYVVFHSYSLLMLGHYCRSFFRSFVLFFSYVTHAYAF